MPTIMIVDNNKNKPILAKVTFECPGAQGPLPVPLHSLHFIL